MLHLIYLFIVFPMASSDAFLFIHPLPGSFRVSEKLQLSCRNALSTPSENQATTTTTRTVALDKPMGLILIEVDKDDPTAGVQVAEMSGAAAKASARGEIDLCLGDVLVSIQDQSVEQWTFDQVMDTLAGITDGPITLEFQRPAGLVAVCFAQNGVAIAALPGTPLCNVAWDAGAKIPFKCRSGSCGTCEQILQVGDKTRYVRPCTDRVPRGVDRIVVGYSDRYENAAP